MKPNPFIKSATSSVGAGRPIWNVFFFFGLFRDSSQALSMAIHSSSVFARSFIFIKCSIFAVRTSRFKDSVQLSDSLSDSNTSSVSVEARYGLPISAELYETLLSSYSKHEVATALFSASTISTRTSFSTLGAWSALRSLSFSALSRASRSTDDMNVRSFDQDTPTAASSQHFNQSLDHKPDEKNSGARLLVSVSLPEVTPFAKGEM